MAALQGAVMLGGMSYFMDSLQTREAEACTALPVRALAGAAACALCGLTVSLVPIACHAFPHRTTWQRCRAARTHKGAALALHPVRQRMK